MTLRYTAFATLVLLPACTACGAGFEAAPQQVQLSIGGKTHMLLEGVPTSIPVNGQSVPVEVVRQPSQIVEVDQFRFNCPSSFRLLSSSSNRDPNSASWMLRGRVSQLTIHRKDKDTSLAYLVDHMAEFYRKLSSVQDLQQKSVSLNVGGKRVPGVRFVMHARGEGKNHQDYFQLPVESDRYHYFLVIHGKPGDVEAEQARDLLGNSLRM